MTEYIQKQPPHVYKKQLPFRLRILQSTKVTVIRSQTTLDKLSRDYKSLRQLHVIHVYLLMVDHLPNIVKINRLF